MKSIRSLFLFALFLAAGSARAQQVPSQQPDYIRYRPAAAPGGADLLETAISCFQKGGQVIDLVAVAHLADRPYFAKLKTLLSGYDAVLYEMAGGPYTRERAELRSKLEAGNPGGADEPSGALAQIGALQAMAGKIFDLSFQLDHLNYLAPNFIHADMDAEELARHSPDGSAGLSDMLTRAMTLAQSGKLQGLPLNEAEANQFMMSIATSVMTGNSNALKRTLGPILAESEGFLNALEDGEESVLISKRNEIVISRIASLPPSSRRVAVLYGAGHMPDLEKRLLQSGYRKTLTEWHAGWTIPQGATANPQAPNFEEMMGKLGGLLQSLGEGAGKVE